MTRPAGGERTGLLTRSDLPGWAYGRDAGDPGEFPYSRGLSRSSGTQPAWATYVVAGHGAPADANARLRGLVAAGAAGFTLRFDEPTLSGLDADAEEAAGTVGQGGVSVSSLGDMQALLDGLPLEDLAVFLAADGTSPILLAIYLVAAERRGVAWNRLTGGCRTDVFRAPAVPPVRPATVEVRLATDLMAFVAEHLPRWEPVVIDGGASDGAGEPAGGHLALALARGLACVEQATRAGVSPGALAPGLSIRLHPQDDLFGTVARFRAARRAWARLVRDRFGLSDGRVEQLRTHAWTSGGPTDAATGGEELVRTTLLTLGAVLGGADVIHAGTARGESPEPAEEATLLALRAQQILATESGVADLVDALGGAYLVERLTCDLEEAWVSAVDRMPSNGRVHQPVVSGPAEPGFAPVDDASVGSSDGARSAGTRLARLRLDRDGDQVRDVLEAVRAAACAGVNLMPPVLAAVRVDATLGEIRRALEEAWAATGDSG